MTGKKKSGILAAVAAVVVIGGAVATASRPFAAPTRLVPSTKATRGDLEIDVVAQGEVRAPHSASLVAPPVNGTLQIVFMLPTGAHVKKDDVVVQFDPSEQEYNGEQAESKLKQAEQDIIKAKADAEVAAAEDQTALLKARFDVRRAELEVQRNELLSEIDARKNNLALQEAQRKLAQLEQDVKSRAASGAAGVKVLEEQRNAARIAMEVARKNIENMTLKAPMDGIVSAKENQDSTGGFFTTGMVLPEYRAGDLVFPGRMLGEVLDVEQMEIQAKISESDRANVTADLPVDVVIDAHPRRMLPGKVKSVAGLAARERWSGASSKQFDAAFQLNKSDVDLRPGVSAQVLIHGAKLKDVITLPVQCVFEKDGKQLVYARNGGAFEPKPVQVKYRTESKVVVEGIADQTDIALADPTKTIRNPKAAAGGPAVGAGK